MTDQTYSTNPLVDQLKARNPLIYTLASRERAVPTMWPGGDLPPMTASGADPAVLLALPPGCRHYGASLANRSELMALLDQQAGGLDGTIIESPGWDEYKARATNWGSGLHSDADPVPVLTAADEEALADAIFGEGGPAAKVPPVADRMEARLEQGRMVWRQAEAEAEQAS